MKRRKRNEKIPNEDGKLSKEKREEILPRISRVHFRHRRAPPLARDARFRWEQKRRKRPVSGECRLGRSGRCPPGHARILSGEMNSTPRSSSGSRINNPRSGAEHQKRPTRRSKDSSPAVESSFSI